MSAELVIRACHAPAPQGSFFARCVGKGRAHRAIVVADNAATKPWRKAVTEAAESAMRAREVPWLVLDEATEVHIVFILARPAAAKRRAWPCVRPDLDKYVRSTFDALTGLVIVDDSRIVRIVAEKIYASDGQAPGARIVVRPLADQPVLTSAP